MDIFWGKQVDFGGALSLLHKYYLPDFEEQVKYRGLDGQDMVLLSVLLFPVSWYFPESLGIYELLGSLTLFTNPLVY